MRTCEKAGCDRRHHARGFCSTHYKNVTDRARPFEPRPRCTVDGCDRLNHARGMCMRHYQQDRYQPAVSEAPGPSVCVDCGGDPLPGGAIRCLACFHVWLDETKGFSRGARVTRDSHDPGRTPVVQARFGGDVRRWVA